MLCWRTELIGSAPRTRHATGLMQPCHSLLRLAGAALFVESDFNSVLIHARSAADGVMSCNLRAEDDFRGARILVSTRNSYLFGYMRRQRTSISHI